MFPDYLELLQCLNDNKVKYLLIGGYAVIRYTEPRYTKDLDIWIEASPANAGKVLKALSEFGAPVDNLTVKDLSKPGLIYVFGIPPLRIDIINRVPGGRFASAWRARQSVPIDGIRVNFASKEVLIKLKEAAGRPQDKADLVKLKSPTHAQKPLRRKRKKGGSSR